VGLDETVNLERLATAFERIAAVLERLVILEERKNPPEREKRAAEIIRPDEDQREQLSDKPSPGWLKETEEVASRFQKRLDDNQKPKPQ